MPSSQLLLVLIGAALVGAAFVPTLIAVALRRIFRVWPDAREAFIGRGAWIALSRRFGPGYAVGASGLALAWFCLGISILPDTQLGAWLLFGPTVLLAGASLALGALAACRWIVDEL